MAKLLNIGANGPIPADPSVTAVIHLLEQALTAAKAGEITSIGLVVCMENGFGASFAGTQGAEINLGLDSLKANILKAISDPSSKSRIVRAR